MPVRHRFRYRLFMMYLDLDELPTLFRGRWFWSASRPALARFRRSDHMGTQDQPLAQSVRDRVEQETGIRPDGPIRLLTNLSYFGYCFNPVSFYYCFESDGRTLASIVAEVNNTPWGQRDTYVLSGNMAIIRGDSLRFRPVKKMHVSPFMPMEIEYDWCFTDPGQRLSVYMANSKDGNRFFEASITMTRSEIRGSSLSRVLATFPLMTCKVIAAIYWQALRLWIKGCTLYAHPGKRRKVAAEA